MKLNHYLARSGISSRRKSSELIENGRVQVNGEVVLEPSRQVADGDRVTVDGKAIVLEKLVYVALNKPVGFTCTLKDRFAKQKVTDLIPQSLGRLYPVGRLDRDSSGLILLTNDGDFSQRISHPRHEIEKEYLVVVSPAFKPDKISVLKTGVLDKGEKLSAREVKILKKEPERSTLRIVLQEGKKREIRRMFASLGYQVEKLIRVRIGEIILGELLVGKYRFLSEEETGCYRERASTRKSALSLRAKRNNPIG